MKTALKLAQTPGKQVTVAVALDADKGAVVLASRKGKAKSLKKAFEAAVKKNKLTAKIKTDGQSLFYGYGTTDVGAEGIFKLALNKTPPGGDIFAHKVFTRIKGAGYGKVVLSTNSGIDDETDETEETEEDVGTPDSLGAVAAGDDPASDAPPPIPEVPLPAAAALTEEQQELEAAQNRVHDPVKLKRILTLLVQQMGKGDVKLLELARTANTALNEGRLADAAAAAARLKTAIDLAANTTVGKVDFEKPRLVWLATRKKAREETDKLRAKLSEHYGPQGIAPAIVASYNGIVGELFGELDESLATTLDAAGSARQPEERARLVGEARAIIGRYEKTVTGPVMAGLEDNPFGKLGLSTMLANSLKMLSASIK